MLVSLLVLLFGCAEKTPPLRIAAAANMQFAAKDLCAAFEKETGQATDLVIGSSGMLYHQILSGAPYDIFLSADLSYPQKLHDANKASALKVYARGQLALWCQTDRPVSEPADLLSPAVQKIAIANPELAPYGAASRELLTTLGLWDSLRPKMVFAESIAQVNQFVSTGAVAGGFTSAAMQFTPAGAARDCWVSLPTTAYAPIEQGVVIVADSEHEAARRFWTYLLSDVQAQRILKSYGYVVD